MPATKKRTKSSKQCGRGATGIEIVVALYFIHYVVKIMLNCYQGFENEQRYYFDNTFEILKAKLLNSIPLGEKRDLDDLKDERIKLLEGYELSYELHKTQSISQIIQTSVKLCNTALGGAIAAMVGDLPTLINTIIHFFTETLSSYCSEHTGVCSQSVEIMIDSMSLVNVFDYVDMTLFLKKLAIILSQREYVQNIFERIQSKTAKLVAGRYYGYSEMDKYDTLHVISNNGGVAITNTPERQKMWEKIKARVGINSKHGYVDLDRQKRIEEDRLTGRGRQTYKKTKKTYTDKNNHVYPVFKKQNTSDYYIMRSDSNGHVRYFKVKNVK